MRKLYLRMGLQSPARDSKRLMAEGVRKHLGAFILVSLVVFCEAGVQLPDAIMFHGPGTHPLAAHVEDAGAPCHAEHCLLGFQPTLTQPLPPLQASLPVTVVPEPPLLAVSPLPPRRPDLGLARPRGPPSPIV